MARNDPKKKKKLNQFVKNLISPLMLGTQFQLG